MGGMLRISNIDFSELVPSRHPGRWTSVSKDGVFFLKIQNLTTKRRQKLSLVETTKLINSCNVANAQCVPELYAHGYLNTKDFSQEFLQESGEYYFQITEYIPPINKIFRADLVISLIELFQLGIFVNDIKVNNLGWKSDRLYFIDFDQAIDINPNDYSDLTIKDTLLMLNSWQLDSLGFRIKELFNKFSIKRSVRKYFTSNGQLDISNLQRFKKQRSTLNAFNNYHKIDTKKIFAPGTRSDGKRVHILEQIQIDDRSKILDIGANLGMVSHHFAERGAKVSATEIDPYTSSLGQTLAIIERVPVKYFPLDKKFEKNEFDFVLLFSVLHHVENFVDFALEIDAISKKILIESRLSERGKVITSDNWKLSGFWNFQNVDSLGEYLLSLFPEKNQITCLGESDKNRFLFEIFRGG
jgi:2-polyprenyl-3-methyl-5-hydroxy-6-metoxy-1,4-benzoquinol methylase